MSVSFETSLSVLRSHARSRNDHGDVIHVALEAAVTLIRFVLAALAVMALSGCNLVVSKTPLFSAGDTQNAVVPRAGWWVQVDHACVFDGGKPVQRWPSCADRALIRPDAVLGFNAIAGAWETYPFVMIPGRPQMVQHEDRREGWSTYYYYGVEPVARDSAGRMTEALLWIAHCEQSDEQSGVGEKDRKLPPGLIPDGETGNCLAADVNVVRAAVVASRGADSMHLRWVRETRPDDFAKRR